MIAPKNAPVFQTWQQAFDLVEIELPDSLGQRPWDPSDADKKAAWALFTELRTRITTQPLHYRAGDEDAALKSVRTLFQTSRDLMHTHGPECELFAELATRVLNEKVRPFTAFWNNKNVSDKLAVEDVRRHFRINLSRLQPHLIQFMNVLGFIALDASYVKTEPAKAQTRTLASDVEKPEIIFADDVVAASISNAEKGAIAERRKHSPSESEFSGYLGLALSGGGIRSSTFSFGVLQAFTQRGLTQNVDYLSTVSGGGYIGTFLTSYLNGTETPEWEHIEKDSPATRYLRDNASYLEGGSSFETLRAGAVLIYGLLANLLAFVPVLFALLAATYLPRVNAFVSKILYGEGLVVPPTAWLAFAGIAFLVLVGYLVVTRVRAGRDNSFLGYPASLALGLIALAAAIEVTARIARPFAAGDGLETWGSFLLGLPLASAGAVGALGSGMGPRVLALLEKGRGVVLRVLLALASLASLGVPAAIYFYAADQFVFAHRESVNGWWLLGASAVSFVLIFVVLNVNLTSAHAFYRDRLCRTFLIQPDDSSDKKISKRDQLKLSRLASDKAPLHLINASVNVPDSKAKSLQGRRADFFVFSKLFCGSPATGYVDTGALEQKDAHLDLGTAMAISGAAASTLMGSYSVKQANWALTLLNVRMGYWLANPAKLSSIWLKLPGPGPSYLLREYSGDADETLPYVNVSDGGHLENLGVYELLRRRCQLIIAVDGEADPSLSCAALMKVMRFAEVDLDVKINIDLDDIRTVQNGFSRAHFNLGTIRYPKISGEERRRLGALSPDDMDPSEVPQTGYLLYIKSSVTGDEPLPVLDYLANHPSFPHQTTADQYFDEAQFEAYRRLGYQIGQALFREDVSPGGYTGVESWLENLKDNMLPKKEVRVE